MRVMYPSFLDACKGRCLMPGIEQHKASIIYHTYVMEYIKLLGIRHIILNTYHIYNITYNAIRHEA